MNEQVKIELLKLAIQITEIILNDSKATVTNNAITKARELYKDLNLSDYTKLLMLIKKELTELARS